MSFIWINSLLAQARQFRMFSVDANPSIFLFSFTIFLYIRHFKKISDGGVVVILRLFAQATCPLPPCLSLSRRTGAQEGEISYAAKLERFYSGHV